VSFGWLGWGLSWLAQAIFFNHSNYYSRSTTVAHWGFDHGYRHAFAQPASMARGSNGFGRTPGGYGQGRGGYNTSYGQGFRPAQGFAGNRLGSGYSRPVQQAYSHMQPAIGRSGYGSSFYGGEQSAYRVPASSFRRNDFAERSSGGFAGKGFSGFSKPPKSGGFHPFGGGGHAPKSFGGGHSGGGGHGFGGGKHHH
jgi:hypothetical protein